jgi:hypothetical protein
MVDGRSSGEVFGLWSKLIALGFCAWSIFQQRPSVSGNNGVARTAAVEPLKTISRRVTRLGREPRFP